MAYSFLVGLLVYRSNWRIKSRLGFGSLTILLLAALLMPYFRWNWVAECLVVLFYFPFLVALGTGTSVTGRAKALCVLYGNISYSLYMTHYSVIWMFVNYYYSHKPGTLQTVAIVSSGVVVMTCFAYPVMVVYDMPVRRHLSAGRAEKLKKETIGA